MIANDNVKPRSAYTADDHEALADIERITDRLAAKIAREVMAQTMLTEDVEGMDREIYARIDAMIAAMAGDPRASARDLGILRDQLFASVVKHGKQLAQLQTFEGGHA